MVSLVFSLIEHIKDVFKIDPLEFKSKIRGADAILIATPEYNYSIPGVLKNAIDFASRPYGDNPFNDKPVAIVSASIGMLGGAKTRYHLRQKIIFLNMYPMNRLTTQSHLCILLILATC